MVVLEATEASGDHAVLKEVRGIPGLGHDERYVIVGEAELQALPAHRVAARDEPRDAAFNRMHAKLTFHDSEMSGEREAALNRRLNQETVPEREHLGPLRPGERCKVAVEVAV